LNVERVLAPAFANLVTQIPAQSFHEPFNAPRVALVKTGKTRRVKKAFNSFFLAPEDGYARQDSRDPFVSAMLSIRLDLLCGP
jgi:hypothetical protein